MLNAGVPATEVAQRLGHSLAMLLKRYANYIDGHQTAASERGLRGLSAMARCEKVGPGARAEHGRAPLRTSHGPATPMRDCAEVFPQPGGFA